jgi:serine protease Do
MRNVTRRTTAVGIAAAMAALAWSSLALNRHMARAAGADKPKAEAPPLKPTDRFSAPFEEVAALIKPSLVSIVSAQKVKAEEESPQLPEEFRHFFGDGFFKHFFQGPAPGKTEIKRALGSGVIVCPDGYILTNAHVVHGAEKVTIKLADGRTYKAKVVGQDTGTDLALLQIKATDLQYAKLGNSDDIEVGQWVVAAGIPFGLSHTITAGVISGKNRWNVGLADYEDFIQTDAPINPGNSGGPLLNLKGEVVGINTAIFTKSGGYMGIGFAIPINIAKSVMTSLMETGHVVRGYLGVEIQELTEELAKSFGYKGTEGVLVGDVAPDSPAAKAGMKQGDIITRYEGKKVKNMYELRSAVAQTKPGTEAKIEVFRDGKEVPLEVKIGQLETKTPTGHAVKSAEELGMTVENLTPELAQELGYEHRHGVVVTEVEPGGTADEAGIQVHDLIVNIQGKAVANVAEFREEMAKQDLKKGVRLLVRRGSTERFVFIRSTE